MAPCPGFAFTVRLPYHSKTWRDMGRAHRKVSQPKMLDQAKIIYLNPRDLLPSQPNVRSDPGDLAGLAETIREHGILQPLGVAREDDAYRIVYGNRRRDAAIVVGLQRVPCVLVQPGNARETLVQQVLENLQRLDLNDLDKARAFEQLTAALTEAGQTQTEALDALSRTLGLSARQMQRYLRLRQLAPDVQRYLAAGDLGVTHAQHLVDIAPASRSKRWPICGRGDPFGGRAIAAVRRAAAQPEHHPRTALAMLRRGERVPTQRQRPSVSPRTWAWRHAAGARTDWPDEEEESPQAPAEGAPPWEGPSAFEGAPLLRACVTIVWSPPHAMAIACSSGSLDVFMDELQRLTRSFKMATCSVLPSTSPPQPSGSAWPAANSVLAEAVAALAAATA